MTNRCDLLTKNQLIEAFAGVGVELGDLVFVHSALRKLGPIDGGADAVIDALLDVVGPTGTVAMPTHTWKVVNASQPLFHQKLTPSNVGILTNVFRQRAGAIRSIHPTHSVAAMGARAGELVAGHEHDDTPCGADGPYGRLRDWGGKILIIGADLSCCTLFHGCEQWAGMAWAVQKETTPLFCMTYEDRLIPTPLHAHFVNTWDQYPRLEKPLLAAGAMRLGQVRACSLRLIDARAAADWLVPQLQRDPSLILPAFLPEEFPNADERSTDGACSRGLQIGWGGVDITPGDPVQLAGQFQARVSEGILDPVTATALAISSGAEPENAAVLVSCDLIAFPDSLRREVCGHLAEMLPALDSGRIVFGVTHTHTGPEVRVADEYARTGGGISSSGNCVELPVISEREYERWAAQRIAQAVVDAWRNRSSGSISYGLGHAVVGHNRRSCFYGGESRMYGDTSVPDFSHIEGGADHDVNLLATWDATGRLTGLMVNLACPAQVGEVGFQISADYWHETRVELRRRFGEKLFVLPQCSAAGDQSPHIQVGKAAHERMAKLAGRSEREEIAVRIADAVSAVMPALAKSRDASAVVRSRAMNLELPWRPLSDSDLSVARDEVDRLAAEVATLRSELDADPALRNRSRWYVPVTAAYRMMKWQEWVLERPSLQRELPRCPVTVQVIQIGEVVFAANPFELYLDFGMQIKARSPAVQTFVVQLAGGGTYVPTARALAGDSYGALPASTPVGPEGGRVLVDATVSAIQEMMK